MSVMAVSNVLGVLSKNVFTRHLMLRRNMNRSEVNPVLGCPSEAELKQLDDVVSPLLKKGQSLHHIAVHHADELMKSERTLYTYTNNGLFTARNIDMPRTIRMRPRKNVSSN